MDDLVSIIMPSYNTGKYIGESIRSVLNQSYQNWELIIVDDASTDQTDEVIKRFSDKRIHYIKNSKNSGAAVSRNLALNKASGHWIAYLDSDDLWKPKKLENQIYFMKKKGYSFSYTEYEEIDEQSRRIGVRVTGPQHISKYGMYNYCWPGCLTVMYDRNVVGEIQIIDIKKNNDYAIWLKAIRKTDCWLLNESLAYYRKRNGSISNHNYFELVKWHYRLFRKAEKFGIIWSSICTIKNIIFGIYKKNKFVIRE